MNPKQHAKRNTVLRVIAFLLIVALVYGALALLAFDVLLSKRDQEHLPSSHGKEADL